MSNNPILCIMRYIRDSFFNGAMEMHKNHKAKMHMEKAHMHHEKAAHHMEMAKKAVGKVGSAAEEKKMAKKGEKKGSKYP